MWLWGVVLTALPLAGGPGNAASDPADGELKLLGHTTVSAYEKAHPGHKLDAWHQRVPKTEVVRIPSSIDGTRQRAIFYDSGSSRPRPLLVVLHSWSADYRQNLDIPFAELAIANDWVFLHPNFRGPNARPQATASDLAVQDVVDAVAFARERAAVDPARVYLAGYSGGAMKALVLAGRRPELWAGVAAWGAIYDIPDWFRHNRHKNPRYQKEIAASCGGVPRPGSPAEAECRERSPVTQLGPAVGRVPVLIAHGLKDDTVPVHNALRAYDNLAAPADRFTDDERSFIETRGKVPSHLAKVGPMSARFDGVGTPVRLERRSRTVTLILFEGGHDMFYNATVRWLSQQRRGRSDPS
jgi:dipeptidyl aminopeptidase/acylaminoacyl peptidase